MIILALNSCASFNKTYSYTLKEKELMMINTLFQDTTTYCLGRYTVDYPTALVESFSSIIVLDNIIIESQPIYPPAFKQRIELREQELQNKKVSDISDAPFLKEIIRLNNGIIFDRNENFNSPDSSRILEAHIYNNGVAFLITTEMTDISKVKYQQRQARFKQNNWQVNEKPEKLTAIKSLILRLAGRPNNEIPTNKGTCIPYGFIQDDGQEHKAKLSILLENQQFSWSLVLDNVYGSEEQSLLERSSEITPAIQQFGVSTLQKGKVNYNHIMGEEWLIKDPNKNSNGHSSLNYRFQYNANEKNVSYFQPLIQILLHTSGKQITTYSEQQLIEIWTRILQTFKIRANAY